MANFSVMTSDLRILLMAKLVDSDIQGFINQAQREEVEAYQWSFLLTNTILYSSASQTTGTVSLTQGSSTVTGSGTNFFLPTNAVSQLAYGSPTGSTPYPIASVESTTSLTLAQPFNGITATDQGYNISTNIYSVIAPNGAPFLEIYNVRGPGQIDLVEISREVLNEKDPGRTCYGGNPPTEWCNAGFDINGNVQIEFWPVNTAVQAFVIEGKIGPSTLVKDTDLPQLPSAVIEAKAAYLAFNALFSSNGNPKYKAAGDEQLARYNVELEKAKFADQQRTVTKKMVQRRPRYGIDVIATHDI